MKNPPLSAAFAALALPSHAAQTDPQARAAFIAEAGAKYGLTDAEIEGWLLCFTTAWAETVRDEALTEALMPKVEALAWHMGNRQDIPAAGHP